MYYAPIEAIENEPVFIEKTVVKNASPSWPKLSLYQPQPRPMHCLQPHFFPTLLSTKTYTVFIYHP